MPLDERGGADSSVELLRRLCLVKGFAVPDERLEPREWGRKPARRDMSGSERRNKTQNELGVCTVLDQR
jgi:hypothetical protein